MGLMGLMGPIGPIGLIGLIGLSFLKAGTQYEELLQDVPRGQ